ncbi:rhodanese-like domain-containing protein [Streptomyces sp. NPDC046805]|uniref:rhodanese-like domain-containing protein n=1 Tax=Streptomyces sp. NPDC046805 TaxID=3155134 RepID=UPI0033E5AF7C
MSLFRGSRGGSARVTVQEAAPRTGHGRVAGNTGTGNSRAAVLLDVPEPYEWQAGHAPDAVHLPLAALVAGAGLPIEAQAGSVVVIRRSGNRSRWGAELPRAQGVEAVDVMDGAEGWADAGLPVVDSRGRNGTVA